MDPNTMRANAGFATPEEPVPTEGEENKEREEKEEEDSLNLPDDPVEKAKKLHEMIKKFSSVAPSAEQLLEWKQRCGGEIFVLYLFDRAFIYRAMRRQEYNLLMEDQDFARLKQPDREAHIVDRCLLWPSYSPSEKAGLPAGIYTTLFSEIQSNSLFLDPQTCAAYTIKL